MKSQFFLHQVNMNQHESDEQEIMLEDAVEDYCELVVYNDDHNTFDWVIECFVDILRHSLEQSEQLSYIIHFCGKASVKVGTFSYLKPLKDALCDKGLSAVIEQ